VEARIAGAYAAIRVVTAMDGLSLGFSMGRAKTGMYRKTNVFESKVAQTQQAPAPI